MKFVRGEIVGHGSFGTVSLAKTINHNKDTPTIMAVKSAPVTNSSSLKNEKEVLSQLSDCPHVVQFLGDSQSYENGTELYNIFLEFASKGSLADHVKNSGGRLAEFDVRRYTRFILEGLNFVHQNGFVHCDIKLQNILMCRNDVVKIADFGLAKKGNDKKVKAFRGTPLYMSPESVTGGEYEAPADIWAVGCVLVEMVSGKPAWKCMDECDVSSLLFRIGVGEELPGIPGELSEEGKDFLRKCFVKDPTKRWTAEMLLNHPFVIVDTVSLKEGYGGNFGSPRCPFDFPEWVCEGSNSSTLDTRGRELESWFGSWTCGQVEDRIRELVADDRPDWSVSDSWIMVR